MSTNTSSHEIHLTTEEASHELYSVVTEVSVTHLAFTMLTVFILVFGMFSALIKERFYAGEAIVATGFGIIFGPYCANLIDPRSWGDPTFNEITLEFTRIVLALSVFAVGVELPRAYVKRHFQSLAMMLGPLMLIGWLVVSGLIYALIPGLSFLGALIVGACLTPTDPILAASVVGKGKFAQKHVPSHIRHLLQAESGSNDGAAFPFLYLAMFLNFREARSVGHAIGMWIVLVILYQITLGVLIGAIVGIAARKVLKFSKRRSLIDRESMVAMYVSLAIFTTSATTLCGSDDLLAAFACGVAFAWDDWFSESIEDSNFSNIIDLLVNCATFIYIGATMPFNDWHNTSTTLVPWRLVVLGILVLAIRRLPAVVLFYKWIPDIKTFREAIFAGFFGPMGVGAIFIATLATTKLPTPSNPPESHDDYLALTIQPIIYFIVLCSVIVHGMSIPFFSLGKRVHSISRTWTQGSQSEPSWLSRVKRVGEGGGNGDVNGEESSPNRSSPEISEKKNADRPDRRDVDLEAGEAVIDDAGMDVGDISERDYSTANNKQRTLGAMQGHAHGSTSSDETAHSDHGRRPGADGEQHEIVRIPGFEEAMAKHRHRHMETDDPILADWAARRERHDDSGDDDEVWEEGDDEVVEHHHGEEVEVHHHDKHNKGKRRDGRSGEDDDAAEDGEPHPAGPGFPGHRMAEIAHMIEHGHELTHKTHSKTSKEKSAAKAEGKPAGKPQGQYEKLLDEAVARAAKKEGREEPADMERSRSRESAVEGGEKNGRSRKSQDSADGGPSGRDRSSSASRPPGREEPPAATEAQDGAAQGSRPSKLMSSMRLPSVAQLRPKPVRRQTLTQEEKMARDAWCRRERRDIDDDEVKAWVSGKHLVIERNNGEDVEVVDANPSREAREQARKDPNLKIREVGIDKVGQEKDNIASESRDLPSSAEGALGAGSSSSPARRGGEQETKGTNTRSSSSTTQPKRFDIRNMPGRQSFKKLFGGDADEQQRSRLPKASPITEEQDEDRPARLRFAKGTQQGQRAPSPTRNEGGTLDQPNYLSTRKTGIALNRSETTDSQVRFASLPQPRRSK